MQGNDQVQGTPEFSDADWDSVVEERSTGVAPAAEPPQEDSQTVDAQAGSTQDPPGTDQSTAEDPYAGLSPAVRAKLEEFDQIAKMLPQLNTTLKETAGRVGSLQSQWAKQQQQLASQPTPAEVEQAAKGKKSWQAIKQEFPEWADGIESLVEERAKPGVTPEMLEQQIAQQYQEKFAEETAKLSRSIVRQAHPTWEKDVQTPEFKSWMSAQSEEAQRLASSTDPDDAISLLKSYYTSRKPAAPSQQDRQRKLEAAADVKNTGRQATVPADAGGESEEDIWAQEAKRRAARRAA